MTESAVAGLYLGVPLLSPDTPQARSRLVESLLQEIALHAGTDLVFDTVYLGGGGPSRLEPELLRRWMARLATTLVVKNDATWSLEADPLDVTPPRLESWHANGVRTLIILVDSFDDETLASSGRAHDGHRARQAVEAARAQGFDTISIDLGYGHAGQTVSAWRSDLTAAVALRPDHLSCYQVVEPATAHGRADLFELTHEFLEGAGYAGYDVTHFASAGEHRSRHTEKYAAHVPILGLGPGAHSYRNARRRWNVAEFEIYASRLDSERSPVEGSEELGPNELALEALIFGLRRHAGVDLDHVEALCGIDLERANRPLIARLCAEGLLECSGRRWVPTGAGLAVADGLASAFVVETTDRL